MTRKQQIIDQAKHEDSDGYFGFIAGAEWADENPSFENTVKFEGHDHKVCLTILRHYHETLYFCAGLISTMEKFKDKNPNEVADWIQEQVKNATPQS